MSEQELLQLQRHLLRSFRYAELERVHTNDAATEHFQVEQQAIDNTMNQARQHAENRQASALAAARARRRSEVVAANAAFSHAREDADAQMAIVEISLEKARSRMTDVSLASLLMGADEHSVEANAHGDSAQALASSTGATSVAAAEVCDLVGRLETERLKTARRRRILVIASCVCLLFIVAAGRLAYADWQERRRVIAAHSTATAEAEATVNAQGTETASRIVVELTATASVIAAHATATADVEETIMVEHTATAAAKVAEVTATASAIAAQATTAAMADPLAFSVAKLEDDLGIAMVFVPDGSFLMGSKSGEGEENEYPQHWVELDSYWIGITEVSNAQFMDFVEDGGYLDQSLWTEAGWEWRETNGVVQPGCWNDPKWNRPDYPVVCVSWYEAIAFVRWLSNESGLTIRLPTEVEWEKAARGQDGRFYPWGDQDATGDMVNFQSRVGETMPVNSYPTGASPYHLLNMSGNVWEWTSSLSWSYPYTGDDGREVIEGNVCCRAVRGGSWTNNRNDIRAARRNLVSPDLRDVNLGLRLVAAPLN